MKFYWVASCFSRNESEEGKGECVRAAQWHDRGIANGQKRLQTT